MGTAKKFTEAALAALKPGSKCSFILYINSAFSPVFALPSSA
jgi:hypothetical protein